MSLVYILALFAFFLMCVLLCGVIMMQESKSSGGLGTAFGAAGDSGDSLFGSSTPDVLRRFTGWLVLAFMVSCVLLSLWTSAFERSRSRQVPSFTMEDIQGSE